MTCIYCNGIVLSIFTALKILHALLIHLPFSSWQPLTFFSPFPECHIFGTIEYVIFSDWILSPNFFFNIYKYLVPQMFFEPSYIILLVSLLRGVHVSLLGSLIPKWP